MNDLLPFFRLYRHYGFMLGAGMLLAFIPLLASIGLLALSGWFLSASFLAGLTLVTAKTFNFFTPGTGVRGFSILRTASRYFERVVNHDITFRLLARLRVDCFVRLEPLSPGILQRYRQADLLNRLVADIDTLDHLYLRLIIPFFCAALGCLSIVILSLIWSGTLAIALLLLFIIYLTALPMLFYLFGKKTGQALTKDISLLRIRILDYINGLTDLMLSGAEPAFKNRVMEQAESLYKKEEKMAFYAGLSSAMVSACHGIILLTVILLSSSLVYQRFIDGPVAAMLAFAALAILEALYPLPLATQMLGRVKSSAARINEIIRQKPIVTFPDKDATDTEKSSAGKAVSIDFINTTYRYPDSIDPVFEKLSLGISSGEKVAITGHTGCGKSTLLNLLIRADNPSGGKILIDHKPVDQLSEFSLRKSMAVMPQRIHIFSATVRDNLQLACPTATDDRLCSLLKSLDLVTTEKDSVTFLDTWVGEGGRALSGGEARRIGIARVLLQNAPIILLDEPTEGLDTITEKQVLKTVLDYCENRTLLAFTHKPAILRYMDRHITWESLQKK